MLFSCPALGSMLKVVLVSDRWPLPVFRSGDRCCDVLVFVPVGRYKLSQSQHFRMCKAQASSDSCCFYQKVKVAPDSSVHRTWQTLCKIMETLNNIFARGLSMIDRLLRQLSLNFHCLIVSSLCFKRCYL